MLAALALFVCGPATAQRRVVVQDLATGRRVTIPENFQEIAANRIAALSSRGRSGVQRFSTDQLTAIYLGNPNRSVRVLGYASSPNEEDTAASRHVAVKDMATGRRYMLHSH